MRFHTARACMVAATDIVALIARAAACLSESGHSLVGDALLIAPREVGIAMGGAMDWQSWSRATWRCMRSGDVSGLRAIIGSPLGSPR